MPLKVSDAKRLLTGPFFSPPDPPAPQRLSKTRKEMILAFKAKPGIHENTGSEEWEHSLFRYLNRKDPKIQTWDVRKWVKAHDWITDRVPAPKIPDEDDEEAEDAIPVHLEKGEPVVIKQEIEEAAATGPLHRAAKPTRKVLIAVFKFLLSQSPVSYIINSIKRLLSFYYS
ncbi:unnamed protein product [Orchesella dallaii]|uniref:Uncharacterized protein n=1 Tax=Orchesella dallaii TaxID=48710 RepID=A0ABP1PM33_9HEXA